ncbi:MAG: P1 family peptidase [Egibacteraceae bacterium]
MALGIEGIRVGCWTHPGGHTGCTVVLAPQGALGAVAVRGGAPGTREVPALGPTGSVRECHAVVLSGGSAFGLATADGVSAWCEAHAIGYDTTVARVPIVGAAIVFDLREAGLARPDRDAGWAACEAATADDPPRGRVGVGAGCTVGKTAGVEWASPGGQGWAVVRGGGVTAGGSGGTPPVTVGALIAVNALGDVLDEEGGVLAGSRAPADRPRYPYPAPLPEAEHTVIGCLATDARLSKPDACRAVDLAHTGIARAVDPAHTTYDGDALFLLCAQRIEASIDLVAHLGARAVAAAIRAAVRASAEGGSDT